MQAINTTPKQFKYDDSILTRDFSPKALHERFRILAAVFDVALAWRIVTALPPEERDARIVPVRTTYGSGLVQLTTTRLRKNPAYDITVPVLVARITADEGPDGTLVIDGYHRMAKAHALGEEWIAGLILTHEETQNVRIR